MSFFYRNILFSCLLLLMLTPCIIDGLCPGFFKGTPPKSRSRIPKLSKYNKKLSKLNIKDVIDDIRDLLTDSQQCWPADQFNNKQSYGPLFIRLAWHCSGSFRGTDQMGGCAGGRIRFEPEASWDDNVNLDKARALLVPIKKKYGKALSWGDLFVFAGTASIIDMGGPVHEICAGRIDEKNGKNSFLLGPNALQEKKIPCEIQGDCPRPLGTDTIGLIYVNPEGFLGEPVPSKSVTQIREIFDRMGMNDTETVALIGGGHAFGKCHGACPNGAGLPPNKAPFNPWPGLCGTGRGLDTFTSGIEGQWTSNPLQWDNEFFKLLVNDKYKLEKGPGDKFQWQNTKKSNLIMLTTDLAFLEDDTYYDIVKLFAKDINVLNKYFAAAWQKLTTNGGTFAKNKKCIMYEDSSDSSSESTQSSGSMKSSKSSKSQRSESE